VFLSKFIRNIAARQMTNQPFQAHCFFRGERILDRKIKNGITGVARYSPERAEAVSL